MSEVIAMTCPRCDAKLKVKAEKVGTTAKCPGCRETISVIPDAEPAPQQQEKPRSTSHLPATQKQKDFATSLGCEFSDSITREEISELIEAGKERQQEARWAAMDAMQDREQSAVDAIRKELLEDMSDDPQVSFATPQQMVESLDDRELAAVVITMPFNQIDTFSALENVDVQLAASPSMSGDDLVETLRYVSRFVTADNGGRAIDPRRLLQESLEDWRDTDSRSERAPNINVFFRDVSSVLLGFDVIAFNEVPVGKVMDLPPKRVLRDFLAILGMALAQRPTQAMSIFDAKMNAKKVQWVIRRIVVREFVDDEWLVFMLDD